MLNLLGIFNDMDFDGDSYITWDDFNAFLVDTARSDKYGLERIKEYKLSSILTHLTADENIKHMKYFHEWDKLVICGTNLRCKVVNPTNFSVNHILPDIEGSFLAMEFIPTRNLLVTSTTDLALRFWDTANDMQLKFEERLSASEASQTALLYDPHHDILLSGSRRGFLHIWDYRFVEEKKEWRFVNRAQSKKVHDDVITDMLILPTNRTLITCSLDSSINIIDMDRWVVVRDLMNRRREPQYNTGRAAAQTNHGIGFFSLSYSDDYDSLIAVGSDHVPLLWLSITHSYRTSRPFQLRDQRQPHQHTLVNVIAVPSTPQVITADRRGMIKVWDVRTLQCVQTMLAEHSSGHNYNQNFLSAFTYIPQDQRIVVGGKGTYVYQYDFLLHPDDADDTGIFFAEYNSKTITFTSGAGDTVKTWDALSGCVSNTFKDLAKGSITALCLDDRGRKFFIGTTEGEIRCFNHFNGYLLKEYPKRNAEITSIVYCPNAKSLVATSSDKNVSRFGDKDQYETIHKDFAPFHENAVICSAYSNSHGLLATVDSPSDSSMNPIEESSRIAIWDVLINQKIADFTSQAGKINCIIFLDDIPILIAGGNGFLSAWTVRPRVHELVMHWTLETIQYSQPNSRHCNAVKLAYRRSNTHLYVADDTGYVSVFDLGHALRKLDLLTDNVSPIRSPNNISLQISNQSSESIRPNHSTLSSTTPEKYPDLIEPMEMFGWQAHSDMITSIQAIRDPPSIMTASLDRSIIIWDLEGNRMDSLKQSQRDTIDIFLSSKESKERQQLEYEVLFNFPIDLGRVRTEEANLVKSVMSRIRSRLGILTSLRRSAKRQALKRSASIAIEHARSMSLKDNDNTFITQQPLDE